MAASEIAEHLGLRTNPALVAGIAIIQASQRKGCAKQEHIEAGSVAVTRNHKLF
ncbi:hypothetical protein ACXM2N_05330 [Corynebacterium sp. ZY180755]